MASDEKKKTSTTQNELKMVFVYSTYTWFPHLRLMLLFTNIRRNLLHWYEATCVIFLASQFICFSLFIFVFVSYLFHYQGLKINLYTVFSKRCLHYLTLLDAVTFGCNWHTLICLTFRWFSPSDTMEYLSMRLANHA